MYALGGQLVQNGVELTAGMVNDAIVRDLAHIISHLNVSNLRLTSGNFTFSPQESVQVQEFLTGMYSAYFQDLNIPVELVSAENKQRVNLLSALSQGTPFF